MYSPVTDERQTDTGSSLINRYSEVRQHTLDLATPLSAEDMTVQSMSDASPTKWHLAHTTWFFETFILASQLPGYVTFDADFTYLFNSYYETVGPRHPRTQRGVLSRPSVDDIMAYRHHVDAQMLALLRSGLAPEAEAAFLLGMAHEEQHQELLLMDVLHLFGLSPLRPSYDPDRPVVSNGRRGRFRRSGGGLEEIGAIPGTFAFDNERPRHSVMLVPFEISDRLVTNGEWIDFINDGGYTRPDLWLSDGWAWIKAESVQAPLYWYIVPERKGWQHLTLSGVAAVDADAPVVHINYYEACAYALWCDARLPTEAEWETAMLAGLLEQSDDVAWQWTQSAYSAYPGFRPTSDALGEYNGKFMSGQMVLRGGASITPKDHTRPTYRNFYRPEQRWMVAGLRLARDRSARLYSVETATEFARDVVAGLTPKVKTLSPKYFYDAHGSDLFEEICLTDEYYPTRTETALLASIVVQIAADIPTGAVLVEFGSGASDKTCLLLDAAPHISMYVPIDISVDALHNAGIRLAQRYPNLSVLPVAGDFTGELSLPPLASNKSKIGFFPGSTIGNFAPAQAVAFLRQARLLLGDGASLIVGADMIKDEATLVAAYDDAAGVTAEFNKNLLTRINRELGGDFDLDNFDHQARWNRKLNRMEMHLVSRVDQLVHVADQAFRFRAGESWHTENSHKFSATSFTLLAVEAGWSIVQEWVSEAPEFGIFHLRAERGE